MEVKGESCRALWPTLDKKRVPGSVASLVAVVAEEKLTFAEDVLGLSADGGAAILALSVAAWVGALWRPVAGLTGAAASFMMLPVSWEMLVAVARGEVALSSPSTSSWDGRTEVACGSAELSLMLWTNIHILRLSWWSDGIAVHAVPGIPSAVIPLPSCTNS